MSIDDPFFSDEEYKKFINNNYYDRVTYVLVIDDDSVTSDEILVDLYSFDDGDLIYVYTLDNLENKYSLFPSVPVLNYKSENERTYKVIAKINDKKDILYTIKYLKHYVISFEDQNKIL